MNAFNLTTFLLMSESLSQVGHLRPTPRHPLSSKSQDWPTMYTKFFCVAFFLPLLSLPAFAQSPEPTATPVEVVVTNSMPAIKPAQIRPRISPTPIMVGESQRVSEPPAVSGSQSTPVTGSTPNAGPNTSRVLTFGQMKSKIAEAKRSMQSRPL